MQRRLKRNIRIKPSGFIQAFSGRKSAERKLQSYLDVCVDGEFEADKKELSLRWKGSSNQRVIDVPETLRQGKIVLHQ